MTTEANDGIPTDEDLNDLLKVQIHARMPVAGDYPTAIKGFVLHRRDATYKTENCFNGPILAVTIQGHKRTLVGNEEYRYGAGYSLVAGVDMPTMSDITHASSDEPYLVVSLDLDSHLTDQLLEQLPKSKLQQKSFKRVAVAKTDPAILKAL